MTPCTSAPADVGAILDALPLVVFRVGSDLRLSYVNQTGCDLVGLTLDEIVGRSCSEVGMDPAAYPGWVEELRRAFRTGNPGHFEYLRHSPPAEQLFEYRFVPERGADGSVASVLVAAVTIDEVKDLRHALHCGEERFKAFMDSVPAIAWIRDEHGRYEFANAAYLDHFRLRSVDRTGKSVEEVWPPEIAAELRANDELVLGTGQSNQFLERAPDPDGKLRSWLNVKFPFRGPDGMRYVGGVGVDVTRREEDARARREFDARVVSAQKIEGLSLLAAGAAHDFKNILAVILGNADLAVTSVPEASPLRAFLDAIISAGERAAELCHRMTAFAGNALPRAGATDLGAIVRDTVRLLHPKGRMQVEVVLEVAADLPRVWGDPCQLSQIILNLFTNAVQALGKKPGTICVRVVEGNMRIVLEVADDGCGIHADNIDRVFDPFFTTKPDGSGLGLAAVASIVRDLGATIEVQSAVGRGATFRVSFPVHAPPPV
jgi:PAS domain S-box-containing protein